MQRAIILLTVLLAIAGATHGEEIRTELYTVIDGARVDAGTLGGFKAWRAAACARCHGANQEGLVGPSLISSLKVLSKAQFIATVTEGRLDKGMPSFKEDQQLIAHIEQLYAYLKGRSNGHITRAKVEGID